MIRSRRRVRGGLTLIESMIILVVLSIVGVGVGIGLKSAVRVPEATDNMLAVSAELTSELEYWRSIAFTSSSSWPATLPYSSTDTVTITAQGRAMVLARSTTIKNWDANDLANNTAPKSDFVQVQVSIGGQTLAVYLSNPL